MFPIVLFEAREASLESATSLQHSRLGIWFSSIVCGYTTIGYRHRTNFSLSKILPNFEVADLGDTDTKIRIF